MSVHTSSQFISAMAYGEDWRDASKTLLEELEAAKKDNADFNFGFLYITDNLAGDASSIVNLFSSVLNIENWIGACGLGICGNGEAHVDRPAISVMIGHFDEDDVCLFPDKSGSDMADDIALRSWLEGHDPMAVIVHGDPTNGEDPALALQSLEEITKGFLVGGLSSSREEHVHFSGGIATQTLSGAVFSDNITIATTLSQGCMPIGGLHTITRGQGHSIYELDDTSALEIFENNLRSFAVKKIDRNPDEILIDEAALEHGEIPEEFHNVFKGEIHAAFPIPGSDQNDYLVRNIIGVDTDSGSIDIAHDIAVGETMILVQRDEVTVQKDLSKSLLELRERVTKDTGRFVPKGALYISCVARAFAEDKSHIADNEMKLIQEIIGDVPLTGFYAGGEISKAKLYGYTGILTLFL